MWITRGANTERRTHKHVSSLIKFNNDFVENSYMVLVSAKAESFYDEASQFDWCGSSNVKMIFRVWLIGIAVIYT